MGKNVHVVPHPEGWAELKEGNQRPSKLFDTQKEAIKHARQSAQNEKSELIIHSKNGAIREKNSYGNDPHPPNG